MLIATQHSDLARELQHAAATAEILTHALRDAQMLACEPIPLLADLLIPLRADAATIHAALEKYLAHLEWKD